MPTAVLRGDDLGAAAVASWQICYCRRKRCYRGAADRRYLTHVECGSYGMTKADITNLA